MRLFFLPLLFFAFYASAQKDHAQHSCRLLYDSVDLVKIIPSIDSLNSDFEKRSCIPFAFSMKQAEAVKVELTLPDCHFAANDLKRSISLEDFLKKYPSAKAQRPVLVTRGPGTNYESRPVMTFNIVEPNDDAEWDIDIEDINSLPKNYRDRVVYQYYAKDAPDSQFIIALFFLEDFRSIELPEKYAKCIAYNETIFDERVKVYNEPDWFSWSQDKSYALDTISNLILSIKNQDHFRYAYSTEEKISKEFDSKKVAAIRKTLEDSPWIKSLFYRAIDYAISNHYSNNLFDYLAGQLVSLETELFMKQARQVFARCGMDNAPKIHSHNIARLALKTNKPALFLSTHLYVMHSFLNECYEESCINKANIAELDFIHVNSAMLLVGAYLSTNENNFPNSSYGKYRKTDFIESSRRYELEKLILELIADSNMDRFNRLHFAKLFAHYIEGDKNEMRKKINLKALIRSCQSFPPSIKFNPGTYLQAEEDQN